jgi:phosphonate transport system permease protein
MFFRSIPEIVWALLFVRAVGLGPAAGVLAIGITYGGMLGKVYSRFLIRRYAPDRAHARNRQRPARWLFFYGMLPVAA